MTIHLNQAELVPLKTPKFTVELRNAGESDVVLNVGLMLANGQKQYPHAEPTRCHIRKPGAGGARRRV
jgi:hypothetical protein